MKWLIFLLPQDSLGGNAKTNLVANVHPSARYVSIYHVCSLQNFAKGGIFWIFMCIFDAVNKNGIARTLPIMYNS